MSRTDESSGDAPVPPLDAAPPLVIRRLEFLGGLAAPGGWRPSSELPEIAFSGRSNVGKSSLLNTLVRHKSLARVSQQPGKTREINFFAVNDAFILVDLPGYGYARASKEERARWQPLIESYLSASVQLRGIVQLFDVRRDPTDHDRQMLEFLAELGVPTVVALTKVDKVSATEARTLVTNVTGALGLESDQVIPFSSVTRQGRDELAAAIESLLAAEPWRSM
jgi:GTP-binding protein